MGVDKFPLNFRASNLLNILQQEEFGLLRKGRDWGEINAGDSVLVERLPFTTATETEKFKGVVIGKVNKASDTAITMLNVMQLFQF